MRKCVELVELTDSVKKAGTYDRVHIDADGIKNLLDEVSNGHKARWRLVVENINQATLLSSCSMHEALVFGEPQKTCWLKGNDS